MEDQKLYDCIVIGAGQSGLSCGYYLRKTNLDYLLLDDEDSAGGSWQHTWDSLTLFSAAKHNALPGKPMPASKGEYPTREEVIDYLQSYEEKFSIPVHRPVRVVDVKRSNHHFELQTNGKTFFSKSVIAATGTYRAQFIPEVPGRKGFQGDQIHSAQYKSPADFIGKQTLVVGGGNSGAQIYAELSRETLSFWGVKSPPEFLPDHVDGKKLFDQATEIYMAKKRGEEVDKKMFDLGNIVMVPSVKEARERGVLDDYKILQGFDKDRVLWEDGTSDFIDAIVWCTGFHYHTDFLDDLTQRLRKGKIATKGTNAQHVEGLWLVGYGGWTGMASATIIGVGRTARKTVKEVESYLNEEQ